MKNAARKKNGFKNHFFLKIVVKMMIGISFFISSTGLLHAQTQLEMSVASYPSPPNGPTVANQTATLLENTTGSTFVAFSPAITCTLAFSNQQYTSVTGISTGTGLSFGTSLNSLAKSATASSVVNTLGTIGTGVNGNHTSNPNGTPGTGIDVNVDYGFHLFVTAEPQYAASTALNGRYYYGDLTMTFNQPVSDPVIQVVGLGGTFVTGGKSQGFTMEYELQSTGVTLSKLSGSTYFNVTANKIINSNTGAIDATCSSGGACGSAKAAGTNITSLVFKLYLRGDGLGIAWSNATTFSGDASTLSVTMNKPVTVSGTIFNDANGTTDGIINGTGTNAGGTLYANLIDANNKIVGTTAVASAGTYSFPSIGEGNYTVSLSTFSATQANAGPAAALPSNYINTAEGITAAGDGIPDGTIGITVANTDLSGVNFGINQYPSAVTNVIAGQINPGGTTQVPVSSSNFSGTDPNTGGQIGSFNFTSFPTSVTSIKISATTYTAATFPAAGVTVTASAGALPANTVSIDPVNGLVVPVISYKTINLAGLASASMATVTLQFTSILPLQFTSFTVKNNSGKMEINWATSNEINISRFEVQKSSDGNVWQLFSIVPAKNKISGSNDYTATDYVPYQKGNYYRVKEIDKDDNFMYSSIVEADNSGGVFSEQVKIIPNPVKNGAVIEIETATPDLKKIIITNAAGKTLQTYTLATTTGVNRCTITGSNKLQSGLYFVTIQNSTGIITGSYKLVKE